MGAIIRKAQITEGGPVILFQPENEYTICADALAGASTGTIDQLSKCLDPEYQATVNAMWLEAGIVVPFISNDALPIGNFVPGSGPGAVDIYGYDGYPLGWGTTCKIAIRKLGFGRTLIWMLLPGSNPEDWDREGANFPSQITNYTRHMEMSPSSPYSIIEFQGGSAEGWYEHMSLQKCVTINNVKGRSGR
jgi:beta-galactosidase